jgi:hypothetical protein
VMTQVDLCLTICQPGGMWLIRSLTLIILIKNVGRHSLPPLRRISSRYSKVQEEVIPSIRTRSYQGRKVSPLSLPNIGNSDGTKDTRCTPYYLIVVHEEAGVERAHVQLIADRFRLRYRDTSLPTSSEASRTLPRTESWVSSWLVSFF